MIHIYDLMQSADNLHIWKSKFRDLYERVTNSMQDKQHIAVLRDSEHCESEEYWLTVQEGIQNVRDSVGAWVGELKAAHFPDSADELQSETYGPGSDHMAITKPLNSDVTSTSWHWLGRKGKFMRPS